MGSSPSPPTIFQKGLSGLEEERIAGENADPALAKVPKEKIGRLFKTNDTALFTRLARLALEEQDIPIEPESIQYKKLLRELLKMFAEACEIERERDNGNYLNDYDKRFSYTETTTNSSVQSPSSNASPTVTPTKLYEEFRKEKKIAGNWMLKTEIDYNSYFQTLVEILGDINASKIDHQLLLDYRDKLIRLPSNRKKTPKYRNKSIEDILRLSSVKAMSLRTANNHPSFVSTLLRWAVRHGYLDRNHGEGLKFKTISVLFSLPLKSAPPQPHDLLVLISSLSRLPSWLKIRQSY